MKIIKADGKLGSVPARSGGGALSWVSKMRQTVLTFVSAAGVGGLVGSEGAAGVATGVWIVVGSGVVVAGGVTGGGHAAIWAVLDRAHAKHPGMVLLHGGSPKGAERIAARWADTRRVPQRVSKKSG